LVRGTQHHERPRDGNPLLPPPMGFAHHNGISDSDKGAVIANLRSLPAVS
jgi:hypothetical protein